MRFSDLFSRKDPSLEEQLAVLARCGITPNQGVQVDQLRIEKRAGQSLYEPLLCSLGDDAEEEPFLPISNNIWHLDTECIEGDGSYVRIARRMESLAGDDLKLQDVRDSIDIDDETASLTFVVDGRAVSWSPRVKSDWIDESIMTKFAQLLEEKRTGKRFTYCSLFGQDCLVGCATPEQLALLKKETGMKFDWLK
jgi:hypothetical protein